MRHYVARGESGIESVAAVRALADWPRPAVARAAAEAAQRLSPRELVAAAILHTELANAIADRTPAAVTFHVERARDLLIAARRGDPIRTDAVWRLWYVSVVSLYTSTQRLQDATWILGDGLRRFPHEPKLYVARGAIAEAATRLAIPDLRRDLPLEPRTRSRVEQAFRSAVVDYLHALEIDDTLASAHLHIGWTRLVLHDGRAADALERAVEHADNDDQRYLAHLFLGGAREQAHRLEDARREYEAALAAGAFQSAYVALSRVEDALGHADRARDLAAAGAQLIKHDDDPWWDYRIGFDRHGLLSLRAEAQR